MKLRLTFLALMISAFAFCQSLEGRWVNTSFSGDENLAYHFIKGNLVKMYYAGQEIPTENPVEYVLKENEDSYLIEMQYINLQNNYKADVVGLIKFLGKDRIEMEFWSKSDVPDKLEFSEESLIYTR